MSMDGDKGCHWIDNQRHFVFNFVCYYGFGVKVCSRIRHCRDCSFVVQYLFTASLTISGYETDNAVLRAEGIRVLKMNSAH